VLQVEGDDAPTLEEYVPAAHNVHAVDPGDDEYEPVAHIVQIPECGSQYEPIGQSNAMYLFVYYVIHSSQWKMRPI
jgi:hypothetical protein